MAWGSIFWKIGFGFVLFSLSVFLGYLWASVGSIRDILRSMKGLVYTLIRNLVTGFVNNEVESLLKSTNQKLNTLSNQLPLLLKNVSGIGASTRPTHSSTPPTNQNSQKMAETVNQNAAETDD